MLLTRNDISSGNVIPELLNSTSHRFERIKVSFRSQKKIVS
jgi:hypothetical protein